MFSFRALLAPRLPYFSCLSVPPLEFSAVITCQVGVGAALPSSPDVFDQHRFMLPRWTLVDQTYVWGLRGRQGRRAYPSVQAALFRVYVVRQSRTLWRGSCSPRRAASSRP